MEVVFSPTSRLHLDLHHQDVRGRADLLQQLGLLGRERTCRQELCHRLPAEGERLLPRGSNSSSLMSQILCFPRSGGSGSYCLKCLPRGHEYQGLHGPVVSVLQYGGAMEPIITMIEVIITITTKA